MVLQTCTEANKAYNAIAKIEQTLSIKKSLEESPLICSEGKKIEVIKQIIRIIEFFLKVTGKELETFQIQVLAGDLYERFRTDTIDDIILMFKMARMGEFGKIYRCDSLEIAEWALKYLDRKAEEREKLMRNPKKTPILPEPEGKKFHELPQELQDKFNQLGSKKPEFAEFIKPKATEILTQEKLRREISRLIDDE